MAGGLNCRASSLQLHAQPYTPAHHFTRGRSDPAFRTKPAPPAARADPPCVVALKPHHGTWARADSPAVPPRPHHHVKNGGVRSVPLTTLRKPSSSRTPAIGRWGTRLIDAWAAT